MICKICNQKISVIKYAVPMENPRGYRHPFCSPKAERSGVPQGCPPSATGCQEALAAGRGETQVSRKPEQGKVADSLVRCQEVNGRTRRPEVVCLCGSTRFVEHFNEWRIRLTHEGKIVLSIEIVTTQSRNNDPQHVNQELKSMLDELHLRKIDLADFVLVLNVGGYIGESTGREIEYAKATGKPIRFLEAVSDAGQRSAQRVLPDNRQAERIRREQPKTMNTPLTPEQHKRTADSLQRLVLRDIPGMTVTEHHGLCIGILAVCYEHVDADLQRAIAEMFESAKAMGMNIRPELVTQRRNSAQNDQAQRRQEPE